MLNGLLDPILATVYPQTCHVCRGTVDSLADGIACGECWAATSIFDGTQKLCAKCGAVDKHGLLHSSRRCGQCEDGLYDAAFACGVYEKALAATVVHLKKYPHLSKRVRGTLDHLVERIAPSSDSVVVPVPLSKKRRFERGHNQAEVIGQAFSEHSRLPIVSNAMRRTDHSPIHRVGMDKRAREATVKNSFSVVAPRLIEGKNVLLVDDVFTSGSTASYCAKVLKKSGAASVKVVTLARAVMYR